MLISKFHPKFIMIGLACGLLLAQPPVPLAAQDQEVDPQAIPEQLHGFSGMLLGRLVSKDVERGEFVVTVDYVPRVWRNNRAERPRVAVGKTFLIDGVRGMWLDRLLVIEPGDTLQFEAQHQRGDRMTFPGELLERAAPYDPENYPVPPDDFRGFRGIVSGTVVNKMEGTLELTMTIDRIERVLDGNRAEDVESAIGKPIVVIGFWQSPMREPYETVRVGDTLRAGLNHLVLQSDHMSVIEFAQVVSDDDSDK